MNDYDILFLVVFVWLWVLTIYVYDLVQKKRRR